MSAQPLAQAAYGRRVAYVVDALRAPSDNVDYVDLGDHPHRGKRIPTEVEKRGVAPDAHSTQHLGVDAGQDLLGGARPGAITIGILVLGCR